ncbi:MAG: acetyl-CoA C-acyltransferase, partial [Planctomycetaceae bacterium]
VGLLLMDADYAQALGHTPLGSIRSYAYAGCDPSRMGLGPVYASAKALADAGTCLADMDSIELNEAFAAQVLACLQAFDKPPADCNHATSSTLGPIDPDKLNVNGGAIAIGHPVGATGARLILTLLRQLQQNQSDLGLATLCIGGGQGGAVVLQRHAAAA